MPAMMKYIPLLLNLAASLFSFSIAHHSSVSTQLDLREVLTSRQSEIEPYNITWPDSTTVWMPGGTYNVTW